MSQKKRSQNTPLKPSESIIKGINNAGIIKEAIASTSLDGETQTLNSQKEQDEWEEANQTPSTLKTPSNERSVK